MGSVRNNLNLMDHEISIQNYVKDNGFAGYIINGNYYLYNSFNYWRLIDDNKIKGYSQSLISDIFGISNNFNKGKYPKHNNIKSNNNNNNNNNKYKQSLLPFKPKKDDIIILQ